MPCDHHCVITWLVASLHNSLPFPQQVASLHATNNKFPMHVLEYPDLPLLYLYIPVPRYLNIIVIQTAQKSKGKSRTDHILARLFSDLVSQNDELEINPYFE